MPPSAQSLHAALPISELVQGAQMRARQVRPDLMVARRGQRERLLELGERALEGARAGRAGDRKSTRLNSSHPSISYAVFRLKKKNLHADTPGIHLRHI